MIRKKIGINLIQYTDIQGIEVCAQNILKHLIESNQDIDFIIFANEVSAKIFDFNYPNVKFVIKKFRTINKWGLILYQQTDLLLRLFFEKVDFLYCPSVAAPIFYKRKIITIHDCAFARFKEEATFLSRLYLRAIFLSAKYFSIKIITISNFSKQEIIELFSINRNKIALISEASPKLPDINETEIDQILEKFNLKDKNYFFHIGNMRPRKNIKGLLEAWQEFHLKNQDYFLVLAGKNDYGIEIDNDKGVIFTGVISEKEKVVFYKKSVAFVFPTLYEGFGLPALEAQFLGTPLIVSNTSSLPEVVGSAAIFIDPYDKESIIAGLEKVVGADFLREELVKDGFNNCQKFSWEKASKELSQVIKDIYEQGY